MTNEEMERAIDFLLKSQVNLEVRIEQTNEQLARTDERVRQLTEQVSAIASTQNEFIQVVTRTFEAQAQINESLRAGIVELAARQSQAEESIVKLAEAQIQTNRRLDALIEIVQRDRNGQ